jgi:hypothetical protein
MLTRNTSGVLRRRQQSRVNPSHGSQFGQPWSPIGFSMTVPTGFPQPVPNESGQTTARPCKPVVKIPVKVEVLVF